MSLILAAALLLQSEPNEVVKSLSWLARHQSPDGSWGKALEKCDCLALPAFPAIDRKAEIQKKCEPLLQVLRDSGATVQAREKAAADLVALGLPAVPFLQDALKDPDVEVRSRATLVLRKLAGPIDKPDLEATSVALLGFLGAGYTHLSKDVVEGIDYGTVVKEALKWILSHQAPNGLFDTALTDGSLLAALAVAEAYGMTGTALFKDPALAALKAVNAAQRKSGMWGEKADDVLTTAHAMLFIKSCQISDLDIDREVVGRAFDAQKKAADKGGEVERAAAVVSGIFFKRRGDVKEYQGKLTSFDAKKGSAAALHLVSLAIFQTDGPAGDNWKKWKETLDNEMPPRQKRSGCAAGSFGGDSAVRTAAFHTLTMEVLYRYQAMSK